MSSLIPIKLVVVGDGYVGKTSILLTYIKQQFKQDYQPTIFDNHSVVVKVGKKNISLGLWDTAGQQQYGSLRPLAYSSCDVFLIIFSVLDKSSFENAKKKWYKQLDKCAPNTCKIFVGNKIDMRDPSNKQHITYQKANKYFMDDLHIPYLECSALTRQGIDQVFISAVKLVLEKRKLQRKQSDLCCQIY